MLQTALALRLLNSGHTVSKISHPQLVRSFCHELTVYAVACVSASDIRR
ncbi:hypothetical protein AC86_5208 [Escherichia coli 3-073-06_S4_C1]|nr:hypothetical protein AC86_5208 [Escherichia coli 3-073-06_S4_C1]